MKNLVIIIILIISNHSLVNAQTNQNQNSLPIETPFLKVGVGAYIPSSELGQFIDVSPSFELSLQFPNSRKNRSIEASLQLVVPQQNNYFLLQGEQRNEEIEATTILNASLRLNKTLLSYPSSALDLGFGMGMASIFLDPVTNSAAQELDYSSINSFLALSSLSYNFEFKDSSVLFISIDLQYTPFKMERGITKNLTSWTLMPKVAYRF
ncbi:hypothetical protein I5168_08665 [Nonlabens sp. SCSIO 43208]|uniref:hypothetical protein n=1 Tax=Nonlabens sp. SCSIO 43208 TaxID=2793009 RepID=UPI003D6C1631